MQRPRHRYRIILVAVWGIMLMLQRRAVSSFSTRIFRKKWRTTRICGSQITCRQRGGCTYFISWTASRSSPTFASRRLLSHIVDSAETAALRHRYQTAIDDATVALDGTEQLHDNDNTIDWRNDPSINPTITFPTWIVPSVHCQKVLSSPQLQQALGSAHEELQHCHPRIKLVQPCSDDKDCVLILRNPSFTGELQEHLDELSIKQGPNVNLTISYSRWTPSYILSKLLPPEAQPPPTAFEQVGHLAHLNLKPHHLPFKKLIGEVLCDRFGSIETVVNKVGQVSGPYRTYDMELLAGKNSTLVNLVENGLRLHLDVAKVYWCSRLGGERLTLLQQLEQDQVIADPFCGVGALCLLAAKERNCTVWANDWNPHAVEFCKQNAKRNGVAHQIHAQCGDGYDFLTDVGLGDNDNKSLPHHVVMNYPLEAPQFLSALRWWPSKKNQVVSKFHVYTFARASEDDGRDAATVAMDLVAHHLLPQARDPTPHRQAELNRLGCDLQAREVRDVAPGKLVMCVTFHATPKLIRHMQGDFV